MAAFSMNLVVPGSDKHCDEFCHEHCDLLLHEECVLLYRQRWLVSVTDFKAALADRQDAAEELKKTRDCKRYWTMQSQLLEGLLKVRRAALADARQKREKLLEADMWYKKQIRHYGRMMPVYERGIEALEDDRKQLELQFHELQQLKLQELQQRRSETATIESNVASPVLKWRFVDRPGQPEPRYTVQV